MEEALTKPPLWRRESGEAGIPDANIGGRPDNYRVPCSDMTCDRFFRYERRRASDYSLGTAGRSEQHSISKEEKLLSNTTVNNYSATTVEKKLISINTDSINSIPKPHPFPQQKLKKQMLN